jgi:DNA-binding CsgD family transcriptional regulator
MLADLVSSIASDRFQKVLLHQMEQNLRIRDLAIYRFRKDTIDILAAETIKRAKRIKGAVGRYVQHFHHKDPFFELLRPSGEHEIVLRTVDIDQIDDKAFRDQLFISESIVSRASIVTRRPNEVLVLSLFRSREQGVFGQREASYLESHAGTLGAIVDKHFSLVTQPELDDLEYIIRMLHRAPASRPLSDREAAVCAHVVMGYSNEAVALNLGVSSHSVSTYRRRAYAKLNVSSQNEIFAILLGRARKPPHLS